MSAFGGSNVSRCRRSSRNADGVGFEKRSGSVDPVLVLLVAEAADLGLDRAPDLAAPHQDESFNGDEVHRVRDLVAVRRLEEDRDCVGRIVIVQKKRIFHSSHNQQLN